MPVKSFTIKRFYYNTALIRVIDDDITPQQKLKWASTKELRRERESVRQNANEKEKERNPKLQPTERELEIFSAMRFHSAIFAFLALLVIKTYRKN